MKRFKLHYGLMIIQLMIHSCINSFASDRISVNNNDSAQLVKLLQNVYKWRASRTEIRDFDVIVKDSFQIGLDIKHLNDNLRDLKVSGYFTDDFIKNYENVGRFVDKKLKSGKYYNEINFPFQDSDPWTFFQDDAGEYWNDFKIADLSINKDSAAFKWYLEPQNRYEVKFKKVNSVWKIIYLQGFDYDKMFKE